MGFGVAYSATFISSVSDPVYYLPVFLRFQNTLMKTRIAPFINLDAGYKFGLSSDFGGGTFVKLSAGIIRKLGYKSAIYAGVYGGLTSIVANLTEMNELGTFKYTGQTTMTNLGLKVGFDF
jgi:hypothetical protein